jgi:hypothetical protein
MRSHASFGVALIAALVTLTAAGCGTSPPSPASPTGAPPLPLQSRSPSATSAHIGTDCGLIPRRGTGSFGAMSGQRAAAAASRSPHLSEFSLAIRAAALDRELNRMRSFTLFVPDNRAFAALSSVQRNYLGIPAHVANVVRHQVVPHSVTPAQIARGGSVVTLSGGRIALGRRGRTYRVGRATVLCGNIKTANGTLYVIDKVLLPLK